MLKHLYFYMDQHGVCPVEEMVADLSPHEGAKVRAYLMMLKEFGHDLRRPLADYIGNGLYELRPYKHQAFYFFFLRDSAVVLHMIRKKTDKLPQNDIVLCLRRKKEVEGALLIKEVEDL